MEELDVAIVGGGPAGLQAALVLARTRKRVVVFDSPEPPRNASAHGVHNFIGLEGLTPAEIRKVAWEEIGRYGTARLARQAVTGIDRPDPQDDFIVSTGDRSWRARHVVLACGYRDVLPEVEGFAACWGASIIPCPFCDGYENRDRLWGVVVPEQTAAMDHFPAMIGNWTDRWLVIVPTGASLTDAQQGDLAARRVPVYRGTIERIEHDAESVTGVVLEGGERVAVETLLWTPPGEPLPLIDRLVGSLGLELNDAGHVATDDRQQTNVDRLWAAGDVQGWQGAIESASAASKAAAMIVAGWYQTPDKKRTAHALTR